MQKNLLPPVDEINQIMQTLYSDAYRENPLLFVLFAFPWGVKGTPLERFKGPRKWQREELEKIAIHIKNNKKLMSEGKDPLVYKFAMASGRGPGKSAFVAWLSLWFMSCIYGGTCIITANTDTQLTDKTFGEINVWFSMMVHSFFFEPTQKSINPAPWFEAVLKKDMQMGSKYYYINGVLWSEDNPEAFVGAHSQIGMMVLFDESSGVPENIFTATRGFFTEKTLFRFWACFSNPRSGAGPFFDIFQDENNGWSTRQLNSLDVEDMDHTELLEIVKKYGVDSDEAAVEVYGRFPRQGDKQFISRAIVEEAATRELENYDTDHEALVMGVDIARFGNDKTVFWYRRGRDARSIPPEEFAGLDNMAVVEKILQAIHTHDPAAIFIDSGAGAGVIDRLKQLGYKPFEVLFGGVASESHLFDHRTELWSRMRDWLPGGMIPNHKELKRDLCTPEKEVLGRESKIKLESKEKMKRRGIKSPDFADALALTFHAKVARKDLLTSRKSKAKRYREPRKGVLD